MNKINVSTENGESESFEVEEINAKLREGTLSPETRAWLPGMSDWKPLSDSAFFSIGVKCENQHTPPPLSEADKLKDKSKEAINEAGKALSKLKEVKDVTVYLPHLKIIDKIIDFFRKVLTHGLLQTVEDWLVKLGHISAILATLLLVALALIGSIKSEEWELFLYSLLGIPLISIAQYIAVKFMGSGKELISRSPGKIATQGFLDALVLISVLTGFLTLCGGFYYMIKFNEPILLGWGCLLAFGSLYVAICGFNPSAVNINLGDKEASVGEEALGLLSFMIKSYMRSIPLIFGLLTTLAFLAMIYSSIDILFGNRFEAYSALVFCNSCFGAILLALLLPFLTYMFFVFYYLWIDVCRALLSLDTSKQKENSLKLDRQQKKI